MNAPDTHRPLGLVWSAQAAPARAPAACFQPAIGALPALALGWLAAPCFSALAPQAAQPDAAPMTRPRAVPRLAPVLKAPAAADATEPRTEDWCLMLAAVVERLRREAQAPAAPGARPPGTAFGRPAGAELSALRATTTDCADALERLNAEVVRLLSDARRARHDLQQTRTALAASRVALRGVQAGERHALHKALHDSLTALPNRTSLHAHLDALLGAGHRGGRRQAEPPALPGTTTASATRSPSAKPLAVLYLDLDGFKAINDDHGHAVGDEVLRIVASRLVHALRAEDLVARLGGDEFVCVLADTPDTARLSHLARMLHDTVAAPIAAGPRTLSVRPSIGIARCPDDGQSTDQLIHQADVAMYRAKRLGLGHAFHDGAAPPTA